MGMGCQNVKIISPNTGITVNNGRKVTISGFTITSVENGIYLLDESQTVINNNCIISNGLYGIISEYSSWANGYATIVNNTIAFNGSAGVRQYGVVLIINTTTYTII